MLLHTPNNTGYLDLVSHEEHKLWLAWLDLQWDNPERSDWYLMQLAAEIEMLRTNKGVHTSSKKLLFRTAKASTDQQGEGEESNNGHGYYTDKPKTVEEATRLAKAQWGLALRGIQTIKKDRDGNRIG